MLRCYPEVGERTRIPWMPVGFSADPVHSVRMNSELRRTLGSARALRFLCTGNVVRSAFAELYARERGCPLAVDSAATTYQHDGLFTETRAALLERGLSGSVLDRFAPRHLSRLGEEDPEGLIVFGMGSEHLEEWRALRPQPGPCFLLAEALGSRRRIADPVLDGVSFTGAFDEIERCVDALLDGLR